MVSLWQSSILCSLFCTKCNYSELLKSEVAPTARCPLIFPLACSTKLKGRGGTSPCPTSEGPSRCGAVPCPRLTWYERAPVLLGIGEGRCEAEGPGNKFLPFRQETHIWSSTKGEDCVQNLGRVSIQISKLDFNIGLHLENSLIF